MRYVASCCDCAAAPSASRAGGAARHVVGGPSVGPAAAASAAGSRPSSGDLGPCGRARAAAAFEPPCRRTAHAPRRARVSAAAWLP
ncbi:hypothetical protein AQ809_28065 [Burkholderia pseudomallei]|nr:hypothetical protein T210_0100455 [Burkholderia pseudomallei MSHR6137]OMW42799.1 hypothetical protein AQ809_28065 [Burkholderia pseudomallei]